MADQKEKATYVSIGLDGSVPLPPAEGANFFHFTVVEHEVQLLVGSVNLLRLHEAKRRGEPITVAPQITHRFLLSPLGFGALKANLEEIAKSVTPSGVVGKGGDSA